MLDLYEELNIMKAQQDTYFTSDRVNYFISVAMKSTILAICREYYPTRRLYHMHIDLASAIRPETIGTIDSVVSRDIFKILDLINKIKDCGIYEDTIELKFKLHQGYYVPKHLIEFRHIHGAEIIAKCKECGKEITFYPLRSYVSERNHTQDALEKPTYTCCYKKHVEITQTRNKYSETGKKNFETFKEFFETESANAGKFTMKDNYTLICAEKGHEIRTGKYVTTKQICEKELSCWVCESGFHSTVLMRLLDKLGVIYQIVERDASSADLKWKCTKETKRYLALTIYTKNKKGHLTGKIVFSDLYGEQQAQANANGLVFRWLEVDKIDDFEYLKQFLYDFFKEITEKNKLKKKVK